VPRPFILQRALRRRPDAFESQVVSRDGDEAILCTMVIRSARNCNGAHLRSLGTRDGDCRQFVDERNTR